MKILCSQTITLIFQGHVSYFILIMCFLDNFVFLVAKYTNVWEKSTFIIDFHSLKLKLLRYSWMVEQAELRPMQTEDFIVWHCSSLSLSYASSTWHHRAFLPLKKHYSQKIIQIRNLTKQVKWPLNMKAYVIHVFFYLLGAQFTGGSTHWEFSQCSRWSICYCLHEATAGFLTCLTSSHSS